MAETSDEGPATSKVFVSSGTLRAGGRNTGYEAVAGWLTLNRDKRESAHVFHTYYRLRRRSASARPLTFVFNGGPGAASAYLHVGAIGPKRVSTPADGSLPDSPVQLVDNAESWLTFTDLVFVDPVGTGLSRMKAPENDKDTNAEKQDETFYWDVSRDLGSLCDFISRFLSKENRWRSPIYLAGESYGGYRGARLTRMLQEQTGVGLSGVVLISPALEWDSLMAGRYNALATALSMPSFAAAARHHGRAKNAIPRESLEAFLARAESFALAELLPASALGGLHGNSPENVAAGLSDWIGLDARFLAARNLRVDRVTFSRELLRDEQRVLGWYDAATSTTDPFPTTAEFSGVDPTLGGLNRIYVAAANMHIRENLGVSSEETYELLNYDVNRKWQWRDATSGSPVPPGATDDLAVGLAMNPAMKILVVHGLYDLVTPYFESKYLLQQLADASTMARDIAFSTYEGGHMFYMWQKSRRSFVRDVRRVY